MKLHVRIFFYIVCLMLCLASNCKKKKKEVHKGPFYLGEIKDYLYFKPGSWWIYQNSISGEFDTVTQTYCDTQFFNKVDPLPDADYYYSYTLLDYKQIYAHNSANVTCKSTPINPITYLFHTHFEKTFYKPVGGGTNENFFYPFDSVYTGFAGSTSYYRGQLDSLTIKGKLYKSIQIFEVSIDETITYPTTSIPLSKGGQGIYYWAKGDGLVKIINNTYRTDNLSKISHSWELVKSNLIK